VLIPDTLNGLPVAGIADGAFSGCGTVTSVTIPDSVNNIGSDVFSFCLSLASVTIGSGVTNIGANAFSPCISLMAITVNPLNPVYCSVNGVLFSHSGTTLVQYPAARTGSYAVPPIVSTIGDDAFLACFGLTSVALSNGVTSIGDGAFGLCLSLTNVTIPDSVTTIGKGAFVACVGLTSATIGDSVNGIGDGAFAGTSLASITIPIASPASAMRRLPASAWPTSR